MSDEMPKLEAYGWNIDDTDLKRTVSRITVKRGDAPNYKPEIKYDGEALIYCGSIIAKLDTPETLQRITNAVATVELPNIGCACIGPRNGEPRCGCMMRAAEIRSQAALNEVKKILQG